MEKSTTFSKLAAAEGKRSVGRPRRRQEDNIRSDLKEIGVKTRN